MMDLFSLLILPNKFQNYFIIIYLNKKGNLNSNLEKH